MKFRFILFIICLLSFYDCKKQSNFPFRLSQIRDIQKQYRYSVVRLYIDGMHLDQISVINIIMTNTLYGEPKSVFSIDEISHNEIKQTDGNTFEPYPFSKQYFCTPININADPLLPLHYKTGWGFNFNRESTFVPEIMFRRNLSCNTIAAGMLSKLVLEETNINNDFGAYYRVFTLYDSLGKQLEEYTVMNSDLHSEPELTYSRCTYPDNSPIVTIKTVYAVDSNIKLDQIKATVGGNNITEVAKPINYIPYSIEVAIPSAYLDDLLFGITDDHKPFVLPLSIGEDSVIYTITEKGLLWSKLNTKWKR